MHGVVERMDEVGRPAWIVAMIAGFVLFFPLGLAILAFLIWSGRMGCSNRSAWGDHGRDHYQDRWQRKMDRMQARMARWQEFGNRAFGNGAFGSRPFGFGGSNFRPSGNRAFDDYRNETIQRLEDEASEFRAFLDRLRHARDKAEFDQFMAERKTHPQPGGEEPGHLDNGAPDTRPSGS